MNDEILQGLKIAVQRGQSLRDAMMSFYNAGYKKQEIEEAARHISISSPVQQKQIQKPKIQEKQQISKYEEKTKPKSKLTLILLITAIVVLIAILVSIFFFRNELIDFFVNLFK